MIKITIELLKKGSRKDKEILAEATIWNNCSGTKTRGNYNYRLWKKRDKTWKEGKIENFPRMSYGVWVLLYRVLKDVFTES